MIGSLDPSKKEIVIIGGGVSGLLLAHHLLNKGWKIDLFESKDRVGGLIETHSMKNGISEGAAHSLLVSAPVRKLFHELGVSLTPLKKGSKARFVVRGGKLRRFPLNLTEVTTVFSRVFFRKSRHEFSDLGSWADFFLGKAARKYLISPLVLGIYGATPEELDLSIAFPNLVVPVGETAFSHFFLGRKRKPKPKLHAPSSGMNSLIQGLKDQLSKSPLVTFHLGKTVTKLPHSPNIAVCTDPHSASRLLHDVYPEVSARLLKVQATPLLSVTLILKNEAFKNSLPPQGVGVLSSESENHRALGILFNSSSFEGRVKDPKLSSFTVLFGGTKDPNVLKLGDQEILELSEMALHSWLKAKPGFVVESKIHRWEKAVPLYNSDLKETLSSLKEALKPKPGLVLFSNWTGTLSIRSMIEELVL